MQYNKKKRRKENIKHKLEILSTKKATQREIALPVLFT